MRPESKAKTNAGKAVNPAITKFSMISCAHAIQVTQNSYIYIYCMQASWTKSTIMHGKGTSINMISGHIAITEAAIDAVVL